MNKVRVDQLEIDEVSIKKKYFSVIESLLFVSGDPIKINEISSILECSNKYAQNLMEEFVYNYNDDESRGIKIIKINESYQLCTKPENGSFVQKLLKTNIRQSLSHAALETLAIIAYKQPITRVQIEEIRGVKSDRAIYTLVDKKLIRENGRLDVPGRPILYITSDEFLKHFQLEDLKQMPNLDSFETFDMNINPDLEAAVDAEINKPSKE